nr:hypothetical protein [Tanacetum cinerariifolium]
IPVIPVLPAEVPIALTDPLVVLEVGAVSVISPTIVLDLVDYSSSSDSDLLEDSFPVEPELPLVLPFLCSDDSEADSESEPAKQRPERHKSLTPSSEFPLAPVVSPPKICSSSDSLSDSSSVHSSRCDALGQSHSGPSTRVASPRLVDPPVRTPRCSEAFMRWRSAPLSTLYLPTIRFIPRFIFESSLDSSSPSAGPSRKRCRSLLLWFRDSYSSKASGEEHMKISTIGAKTVTNLGASDGVRAPTKYGLGMGVEVATSDIREDREEFEVEASARGTMEIAVDPLATMVFLSLLEEMLLILRVLFMIYLITCLRVRSLARENLRVRALLCIKRVRVDSLRSHMALSQEEFH